MTPININSEVTHFLDVQNHPFRKEIEILRKIILHANVELNENIKWNGPNYSLGLEDRITMRIQPPKQIQLIFHRGATVKAQPNDRLLKDDFGLLDWKSNDRAVATFKNLEEIENKKPTINQLVIEWILATK